MGKPKCEICRKKCSGDILRADGDKYFHIACFKCKKCDRPLTDTGFFTGPDGVYVCPDDYHSAARPLHVHASRHDHSPPQSQSQHSPPMVLGSPTGCAQCGQPLQSGQVLLALGQQWHVWCFKCSVCEAVLQGEYMTHDGKPLCIRDYNKEHGVRCHECNKYIAGKVLQAGGYKFHPTCARCTRCGTHFGDGAEMYMQGDEIWHPQCQLRPQLEQQQQQKPSKKSTGGILKARSKADNDNNQQQSTQQQQQQPKYQVHFGQHLIYMYLLPEVEQTYLKQPIPPHPPLPAQFHTPLVPVKIRKSRISMLKTGMQRLAEDLDRKQPRAKSPHMDNEEPIEMAHYPAGHAPEPGETPAIDRDDFPTPPYPYAVEEMRRRLSTSSVENDDDEEFDEKDGENEQRIKKMEMQLEKLDNDCSIAHVLKQQMEENQKKNKLSIFSDPRNASRTPSAKKMPHYKLRYDIPVNASPSRYENRPRPWVKWGPLDKSATATIPCFHLPLSQTMYAKAATLPDGYHYGHSMDTLDSSVHFGSGTLPVVNGSRTVGDERRGHGGHGGGAYAGETPVGTARSGMRMSLPDMSKPPAIYELEQLRTTNKALPEDVDRQHLERHLSRIEFEQLFSMSPIEFYRLPEWKRINLKRQAKLF